MVPIPEQISPESPRKALTKRIAGKGLRDILYQNCGVWVISNRYMFKEGSMRDFKYGTMHGVMYIRADK